MSWQLLSLNIQSAGQESLEGLLFEAGAMAVTTLPLGGQEILEPKPGETPLWQSCRLVAQFEERLDLEPLIALCRGMGFEQPEVEWLEDEVWERVCLADWKPVCYGNRLWVVPGGERLAEVDSDRQILLDPGLAFGTGSHPTTALCLEWLAHADLKGASLLDYGCGSGILAIAGARLGAEQVYGTDIDPQALTASRDNAVKNHLHDKVILIENEQLPAWLARGGTVDILVANIIMTVLIELLPLFTKLLATGGRLVLSGLLAAQQQQLEQALSTGFDLIRVEEKQGWLLLEAVKG